jgi:hypothetical protein
VLENRDCNELSGSVRRIVSHLFLNHGFLSMAVSRKPGFSRGVSLHHINRAFFRSMGQKLR